MNRRVMVYVGVMLGAMRFTASAHAATIEQLVQFDGVTPKRLYELYLSSKEHSAFTNFGKGPNDSDYYPAEIDSREGGEFEAFIGFPQKGNIGIQGKILQLDAAAHAANTYVIVQSWRGGHEGESDPDTTLTLTFRKTPAAVDPKGDSAEIELVQANVPDGLLAITQSSWNARYWGPLREYLAASRKSGK